MTVPNSLNGSSGFIGSDAPIDNKSIGNNQSPEHSDLLKNLIEGSEIDSFFNRTDRAPHQQTSVTAGNIDATLKLVENDILNHFELAALDSDSERIEPESGIKHVDDDAEDRRDIDSVAEGQSSGLEMEVENDDVILNLHDLNLDEFSYPDSDGESIELESLPAIGIKHVDDDAEDRRDIDSVAEGQSSGSEMEVEDDDDAEDRKDIDSVAEGQSPGSEMEVESEDDLEQNTTVISASPENLAEYNAPRPPQTSNEINTILSSDLDTSQMENNYYFDNNEYCLTWQCRGALDPNFPCPSSADFTHPNQPAAYNTEFIAVTSNDGSNKIERVEWNVDVVRRGPPNGQQPAAWEVHFRDWEVIAEAAHPTRGIPDRSDIAEMAPTHIKHCHVINPPTLQHIESYLATRGLDPDTNIFQIRNPDLAAFEEISAEEMTASQNFWSENVNATGGTNASTTRAFLGAIDADYNTSLMITRIDVEREDLGSRKAYNMTFVTFNRQSDF